MDKETSSVLFEGARFNGTELQYIFRKLDEDEQAGVKGGEMAFSGDKYLRKCAAGWVYTVELSDKGLYPSTLKMKHRYYAANEIGQVKTDHHMAVKAEAKYKQAKSGKLEHLENALETLTDAYWKTNARGREMLLAHIIRKITKG